jgi:hypothetical protein
MANKCVNPDNKAKTDTTRKDELDCRRKQKERKKTQTAKFNL